jgi:hypothetical protein
MCRPAARATNRSSREDEVVLKELRNISRKAGIKQLELIAEGRNYVLTRYRKRAAVTRGYRSAGVPPPISCGTF